MDEQRIARLNVTYGGGNGDLPDGVDYTTTDANLKQIVEESITNGYIPGIPATPNPDLKGFVFERFPAEGELPDRIFARPKTDFGF